MAEAARHADPERPHQLGIGIDRLVGIVGVVAIHDACLPIAARLGRRLRVSEEVGIEEQPQADDAAGIAVDRRVEAIAGELGAHLGVERAIAGLEQFLGGLVGQGAADRRLAGLGVDILVEFGVGLRQLDLIAISLVEVEAEDPLVLLELGLHARLVDQPRFRKARAALARIQEDEEVRQPVAVLLYPVPEDLVALAPGNPGVLAANGVARVLGHLRSIGIGERVQPTVRTDHLVDAPEEVALLGGKEILCPLGDRRSGFRHAALRLVGRRGSVELVRVRRPSLLGKPE